MNLRTAPEPDRARDKDRILFDAAVSDRAIVEVDPEAESSLRDTDDHRGAFGSGVHTPRTPHETQRHALASSRVVRGRGFAQHRIGSSGFDRVAVPRVSRIVIGERELGGCITAPTLQVRELLPTPDVL